MPIVKPYPSDPTLYSLVSDRIDLEQKYSYWTRVVPRGFSEKTIASLTYGGALHVCLSAPTESMDGSVDDVVFVTLRLSTALTSMTQGMSFDIQLMEQNDFAPDTLIEEFLDVSVYEETPTVLTKKLDLSQYDGFGTDCKVYAKISCPDWPSWQWEGTLSTTTAAIEVNKVSSYSVGAPSNLSASQGDYSDKVQLTWTWPDAGYGPFSSSASGWTGELIRESPVGRHRISAGSSHSLALMTNGTVVAWGRNVEGQVSVPAGLSDVVEISAGGNHSLALKSDGTVVAWGDNEEGQSLVPQGLSGVIKISAGGNHSLALKSDGTVVAWGLDYYNQASVPSGLSGVISVAAGGLHSLALKSDGTVMAWGDNIAGETVVPAGLSDVVAISAGDFYSVALKSDGTVVVWGQEIARPMGSDVVSVSAGDRHGLALKSDGTVTQLIDYRSIPVGLSNVVAIAAGGDHSLALKSDGTVVAWGSNYEGEGDVPDFLSEISYFNASFILGEHGQRTGGGGSFQTVSEGESAEGLVVTAQDGWSFTGWDKALGPITSNTIIYACYNDAYETDDAAGWATVIPTDSPSAQTNSEHSLNTYDVEDWFSLDLKSGLSYRFSVDVRGGTISAALYKQDFSDPSGISQVQSIANNASDFDITFDPISDDFYYLVIQPHTITSGNIYYSLVSQQVAGPDADSWDPVDDTQAEASLLTISQTLQSHGEHNTTSTDEDWFKVYLEAGKTYEFYSEGSYGVEDILAQISTAPDAFPMQSSAYPDGYNFRLDLIPTITGSYYILVVGNKGSTSLSYTLKYREVPVSSNGPINDDFAAALSLSGTTGTQSGTNVEATGESGEPEHAGIWGGKSVWWNWTAPADGNVTFQTAGSAFDTVMAAYIGSSLDSLSEVSSNDDYGGRQSKITFVVTAGEVYRIAVDGYHGESGSVVLQWSMSDVVVEPFSGDYHAEIRRIFYEATGQTSYAAEMVFFAPDGRTFSGGAFTSPDDYSSALEGNGDVREIASGEYSDFDSFKAETPSGTYVVDFSYTSGADEQLRVTVGDYSTSSFPAYVQPQNIFHGDTTDLQPTFELGTTVWDWIEIEDKVTGEEAFFTVNMSGDSSVTVDTPLQAGRTYIAHIDRNEFNGEWGPGSTYVMEFVVAVPVSEYTLTSSAGTGGGVSPASSIVEEGESQIFIASPNTGYEVDVWKVNGVQEQVGGNSFTLSNVQADASVFVTFKKQTMSVTISQPSEGSILQEPETVLYGETATFTADVPTGYRFKHWVINSQEVGAGQERYAVENITSATTVEVVFEKKAVMPWLNLLLE